MRQRLLHGYSLFRVECLDYESSVEDRPNTVNGTHKTPCKEVHCKGIGVGEELCEWLSLAEWQRANVIAGPPCRDGVKLIECRRPEYVED